jgi:hypothetical protein
MRRFKSEDYPCYHEDASLASMVSQRRYKRLILVILLLMAISTVLQSFPNKVDNRIKGIILLVGFLSTVLMMIFHPDKSWYIGRAVAESIKTLSWRYMMKSQPFDQQNSDDNFINRCSEILNAAIQNERFVHKPKCKHRDLITPAMKEIRNLTSDEQKSVYLEDRIKDQIVWYQAKSKINGSLAFVSISVIALCQLAAIIFLLFWSYLSLDFTSIMVVIATSVISIMEMNKYRELERSYSFTAFELNNIRNRFGLITNNVDLNIFVEEAEQAISREHTMWLARKGHFKN